MATPKTVWGIDIGQVALKALKLRNVDGELQVEAFDIIEHPKILSQPDADRRQLIRNALEQFLARNDLTDSTIVVAVPGQSSFTRFVKLPPVDPKKIPDIVRFEAEQQIPFAIDEVQWRYQTFRDPDSPDVEVGIFAVKQGDIDELMDRFVEVEMKVDVIQMPAMALYNFMTYDNQLAADGATLLVDIGADKTDLVVADGPRMWVRTIQIGGNSFTESLVKAFKYPFAKAEKLKRTAVSHKYARQIFQAMRPVFADLVQEIHRSIGAYTATHRETRFKKLVGMGNGFRMPGLQKYLEQNLSIPVVPIDNFNKLTPSSTINAPTFTQNMLSFGVAYGLALQGMGETVISTNLLPEKIQEALKWKQRQWWFAGAAAALLVAMTLPVISTYSATRKLSTGAEKAEQAKAILADGKRAEQAYNQQRTALQQEQQSVAHLMDPLKYREFWPAAQAVVLNSFSDPSVAPGAKLYMNYCLAADSTQRDLLLPAIRKAGWRRDASGKPMLYRTGREVFFITDMTATYSTDLMAMGDQSAAGGAPGASPAPAPSATPGQTVRGFYIVIKGYTPMDTGTFYYRILGNPNSPQSGSIKSVMEALATQMTDSAGHTKLLELKEIKPLKYVTRKEAGGATVAPPAGGTSTQPVVLMPDPLFPDEDTINDTVFEIGVKIAITVDDPSSSVATAGAAGRSKGM